MEEDWLLSVFKDQDFTKQTTVLQKNQRVKRARLKKVPVLVAENREIADNSFIVFALVAQLDRVPGYEPGGQRFESSPVHTFYR